MNARAIPRAAISGYVKVLRLPLDLVVGRTGNEAAELTLDRTEATVLAVAGTVIGDQELKEDAARRRAAADDREEALRLRAEAQRTRSQADERLSQRHEEAERRRKSAEEQAEQRRKSAQEKRNEKKQT